MLQGQKQSFADVLKIFCKFDRKTPVLESLLNKVADLKDCKFIKKRLQHWCFLVKFAKFLRTHIFTEHLQRLLLTGRVFLQNSKMTPTAIPQKILGKTETEFLKKDCDYLKLTSLSIFIYFYELLIAKRKKVKLT